MEKSNKEIRFIIIYYGMDSDKLYYHRFLRLSSIAL